jgi:hypothetical protein
MFGCYRRGDANDPDTYVAAITAVLSRYDADTIHAVTDPYSGLPGQKKENGYGGMPDVADVKEACEAEANRRQRIQELGKLKLTPVLRLPRPKTPGYRANLFVPKGAPQYAAVLAMSQAKSADPFDWRYDNERGGLWVPHHWVGSVKGTAFTQVKVPAREQMQEAAE